MSEYIPIYTAISRVTKLDGPYVKRNYNTLRTIESIAYRCVPPRTNCVPLRTVAISVTVRGRGKRTKIWDHKGYNSQITNIFKNSKLYRK